MTEPEYANSKLAELEAQERALSQRRTTLHGQIDFALSDPETPLGRIQDLRDLENDLSAQRQDLLNVINETRKELKLSPRPIPREEREEWR